MRTNIDIEDEQMERALELSGLSTKKEVVAEALRVLIETLERKPLSEIRGRIKFAKGYNHKKLRN